MNEKTPECVLADPSVHYSHIGLAERACTQKSRVGHRSYDQRKHDFQFPKSCQSVANSLETRYRELNPFPGLKLSR